MGKTLTEFTRDDMKNGVKFLISGDSGVEYEVSCNSASTTFIHEAHNNVLISQVNKITTKGFYWSKWYFGKRITGVHPWTALRKIVEEKEAPNV